MVKFSAAMRAENWRSPQYISSAPAARAAKKAALLPAGARIKGRRGIGVSSFFIGLQTFRFRIQGLTATITISRGIIK
jgi:hypothetical protein